MALLKFSKDKVFLSNKQFQFQNWYKINVISIQLTETTVWENSVVVEEMNEEKCYILCEFMCNRRTKIGISRQNDV